MKVRRAVSDPFFSLSYFSGINQPVLWLNCTGIKSIMLPLQINAAIKKISFPPTSYRSCETKTLFLVTYFNSTVELDSQMVVKNYSR